uniref:Uncharacterized protein n=1 Tax=Vitis vinifera TaxID=29760 RepID=A5CBN1_VITVI|nr:hypothetical protein VITISV_016963 [Vitis vinifera]
MKSSNSRRTKLWSSIALCQSRSKYARREARRKEKQSEENRGQAAAVFMRTFGALSEVHFLHSIYHFKAQEVKNPMLQTVINFVDYSLNQGAPAGHESAETPIGHESNGAVAGDRTPNQMVPLPLPMLGTNQPISLHSCRSSPLYKLGVPLGALPIVQKFNI